MIFGNQAPKFIHDYAGANTTVLLDYIVPTKDEPEDDIIIHPSIFTGHREIIILGRYWVYECKLHLYKYGTPTPQEKYLELKSYEGSLVRFYRHRDGEYLKDNAGAEVEMFLESIDESYYKTTDYKDLLFLRFKSTEYVDLTQGLGV